MQKNIHEPLIPNGDNEFQSPIGGAKLSDDSRSPAIPQMTEDEQVLVDQCINKASHAQNLKYIFQTMSLPSRKLVDLKYEQSKENKIDDKDAKDSDLICYLLSNTDINLIIDKLQKMSDLQEKLVSPHQQYNDNEGEDRLKSMPKDSNLLCHTPQDIAKEIKILIEDLNITISDQFQVNETKLEDQEDFQLPSGITRKFQIQKIKDHSPIINQHLKLIENSFYAQRSNLKEFRDMIKGSFEVFATFNQGETTQFTKDFQFYYVELLRLNILCIKKIFEIIDQLYQISSQKDNFFDKHLPEQWEMSKIKEVIAQIEEWNSEQEAIRQKLEVPNTFTQFIYTMKDTNASAGLTKHSYTFMRSHTVVSFDYRKIGENPDSKAHNEEQLSQETFCCCMGLKQGIKISTYLSLFSAFIALAQIVFQVLKEDDETQKTQALNIVSMIFSVPYVFITYINIQWLRKDDQDSRRQLWKAFRFMFYLYSFLGVLTIIYAFLCAMRKTRKLIQSITTISIPLTEVFAWSGATIGLILTICYVYFRSYRYAILNGDFDFGKYGEYPNKVTNSKYGLIDFLPRNLLFQFQKLTNIYFLFTCILQTIPSISITQGIPTMLSALMSTLSISIGKDAYEDIRLYFKDKKENETPVESYSQKNQQWAKLRPGEMVKIYQDDPIPADVIVVNSSDKDGLIQYESMALDGETSIKEVHVPKEIVASNNFGLISNFENFLGQIVVLDSKDDKNKSMYSLNAELEIISGDEKLTVKLTGENMLLRGCTLKNTEYVHAIVLSTGSNMKIIQNNVHKQDKIIKFSKLQNSVNIQTTIYIIFYKMFLCVVASVLSMAFLQSMTDHTVSDLEYHAQKTNYLGIDKRVKITLYRECLRFIQGVATWFLMLTNLIPISLWATLEGVNLLKAQFVSMDLLLFDYDNQKYPSAYIKVHSSNLLDELGQIEYIFSDKSGTITMNDMSMTNFTVGNKKFGSEDQTQGSIINDKNFLKALKSKDLDVLEFLEALALCHSVQVDKVNNGRYKSDSPDELSLVQFASDSGVEYTGKDFRNNVSLNDKLNEKLKVYKLIGQIEFDSDRKMSTCIYQVVLTNDIFVLSKGADFVMRDRISKSDEQRQILEFTDEQCKVYSNLGLRTLYVARRKITKQKFEEWDKAVRNARNQEIKNDKDQNKYDKNMKNMEAQLPDHEVMTIGKANDILESDMELIGMTAIKDKLQEDVNETVDFLKEAGIKVWVITGDKVETAVNVCRQAELIDDKTTYIRLQLQVKTQRTHYDEKTSVKDFINLVIKDWGKQVEQSSKYADALVEQYIETVADLRKLKPTHYGLIGMPIGLQIQIEEYLSIDQFDFLHSNKYQIDIYKPEDARNPSFIKNNMTIDEMINKIREICANDYIDDKEYLKDIRNQNGLKDKQKIGIVLEGPVLATIQSDKETLELFQDIIKYLDFVVACRVTPKEKSDIVQIVKQKYPEKSILGIGDGLNDLSMIQTANIGVGIFGKEGKTAANSADFAIGQFKFLKRLMTVHGRESYRRTSTLILYQIYKNALYVMAGHFWPGLVSAFSGCSIYDSGLYNSFNMMMTTLHIVWYSVGDFEYDKSLEQPIIEQLKRSKIPIDGSVDIVEVIREFDVKELQTPQKRMNNWQKLISAIQSQPQQNDIIEITPSLMAKMPKFSDPQIQTQLKNAWETQDFKVDEEVIVNKDLNQQSNDVNLSLNRQFIIQVNQKKIKQFVKGFFDRLENSRATDQGIDLLMKILKVYFFEQKLNKESFEEKDFDVVFSKFKDNLSDHGKINLENVSQLIKDEIFDEASEQIQIQLQEPQGEILDKMKKQTKQKFLEDQSPIKQIMLEYIPSMYRIGIQNECFNFKEFILTFISGTFIDSAIIFSLIYILLGNSSMSDGKEFGMTQIGMIIYCSSCFTADIWVMMRFSQIGIFEILSLLGTFGAPHFFFFLYSQVSNLKSHRYNPIWKEFWQQLDPQILQIYAFIFVIMIAKETFRPQIKKLIQGDYFWIMQDQINQKIPQIQDQDELREKEHQRDMQLRKEQEKEALMNQIQIVSRNEPLTQLNTQYNTKWLDTQILTQQMQDQIHALTQFQGKKLTKIFSGPKIGTADDYHKAVGGLSPTAVFYQTQNGRVFGMYTQIIWAKRDIQDDGSSRIFRFDENNDFKEEIKIKQGVIWTVGNPKYYFVIHGGPGLWGDLLHGKFSSDYWDVPDSIDTETYLVGEAWPAIKNMEVYKIEDLPTEIVGGYQEELDLKCYNSACQQLELKKIKGDGSEDTPMIVFTKVQFNLTVRSVNDLQMSGDYQDSKVKLGWMTDRETRSSIYSPAASYDQENQKASFDYEFAGVKLDLSYDSYKQTFQNQPSKFTLEYADQVDDQIIGTAKLLLSDYANKVAESGESEFDETVELLQVDGNKCSLQIILQCELLGGIPDSSSNQPAEIVHHVDSSQNPELSDLIRLGIYKNLGHLYRCETCAKVYWKNELRLNIQQKRTGMNQPLQTQDYDAVNFSLVQIFDNKLILSRAVEGEDIINTIPEQQFMEFKNYGALTHDQIQDDQQVLDDNSSLNDQFKEFQIHLNIRSDGSRTSHQHNSLFQSIQIKAMTQDHSRQFFELHVKELKQSFKNIRRQNISVSQLIREFYAKDFDMFTTKDQRNQAVQALQEFYSSLSFDMNDEVYDNLQNRVQALRALYVHDNQQMKRQMAQFLSADNFESNYKLIIDILNIIQMEKYQRCLTDFARSKTQIEQFFQNLDINQVDVFRRVIDCSNPECYEELMQLFLIRTNVNPAIKKDKIYSNLVKQIEGFNQLREIKLEAKLKQQQENLEKQIPQMFLTLAQNQTQNLIYQIISQLDDYVPFKCPKLLWKGSRDGYSKKVIDKAIEYKSNTIIVYETKLGEVCGAFTPIEWDYSKDSKTSEGKYRSFIYCYRNNSVEVFMLKKSVETFGLNQCETQSFTFKQNAIWTNESSNPDATTTAWLKLGGCDVKDFIDTEYYLSQEQNSDNGYIKLKDAEIYQLVPKTDFLGERLEDIRNKFSDVSKQEIQHENSKREQNLTNKSLNLLKRKLYDMKTKPELMQHYASKRQIDNQQFETILKDCTGMTKSFDPATLDQLWNLLDLTQEKQETLSQDKIQLFLEVAIGAFIDQDQSLLKFESNLIHNKIQVAQSLKQHLEQTELKIVALQQKASRLEKESRAFMRRDYSKTTQVAHLSDGLWLMSCQKYPDRLFSTKNGTGTWRYIEGNQSIDDHSKLQFFQLPQSKYYTFNSLAVPDSYAYIMNNGTWVRVCPAQLYDVHSWQIIFKEEDSKGQKYFVLKNKADYEDVNWTNRYLYVDGDDFYFKARSGEPGPEGYFTFQRPPHYKDVIDPSAENLIKADIELKEQMIEEYTDAQSKLKKTLDDQVEMIKNQKAIYDEEASKIREELQSMKETDNQEAIYLEEERKELNKFDRSKKAGYLNRFVNHADADIISHVYEQMVSEVEHEYENDLMQQMTEDAIQQLQGLILENYQEVAGQEQDFVANVLDQMNDFMLKELYDQAQFEEELTTNCMQQLIDEIHFTLCTELYEDKYLEILRELSDLNEKEIMWFLNVDKYSERELFRRMHLKAKNDDQQVISNHIHKLMFIAEQDDERFIIVHNSDTTETIIYKNRNCAQDYKAPSLSKDVLTKENSDGNLSLEDFFIGNTIKYRDIELKLTSHEVVPQITKQLWWMTLDQLNGYKLQQWNKQYFGFATLDSDLHWLQGPMQFREVSDGYYTITSQRHPHEFMYVSDTQPHQVFAQDVRGGIILGENAHWKLHFKGKDQQNRSYYVLSSKMYPDKFLFSDKDNWAYCRQGDPGPKGYLYLKVQPKPQQDIDLSEGYYTIASKKYPDQYLSTILDRSDKRNCHTKGDRKVNNHSMFKFQFDKVSGWYQFSSKASPKKCVYINDGGSEVRIWYYFEQKEASTIWKFIFKEEDQDGNRYYMMTTAEESYFKDRFVYLNDNQQFTACQGDPGPAGYFCIKRVEQFDDGSEDQNDESIEEGQQDVVVVNEFPDVIVYDDGPDVVVVDDAYYRPDVVVVDDY